LSAAAIEWILIGPDGLVAASFPGVAEDVTDLPAGRYVDALRVTTVKNGRQTVWRGCVLVDTAPPPVPLPSVVPPSPISIAIGGLAIGAPGFVLAQYHQGQTTVPRLLALLRGFGIDISKRELVRLLTTGHDSFHEEAREVLRAGLASAAWITVDDTSARHKANNGFCTQIGNAHFTAFATTTSKSRLNFLSLLRAGHGDYVVNDAALAYMRERALAAHVIALLTEHPDRHFADQAAWAAHLENLGIAALKVNPDPTLIATEGALWGSVKAHCFLCTTARF